jgi:hypothetical protein
MSWQIPTQIELDIIAGKAVYRTFQTGNGGQSILQVPTNSYAVIFGYDFSPAGGGLSIVNLVQPIATDGFRQHSAVARWFETQQISFYTGNDFYPFIHHVNVEESAVVGSTNASTPDNETTETVYSILTINNSPIARQLYITSTNDVTITHGLILTSARASANAIPITNRTPQALTYGGSAQTMNTQTDYGPILTPQQFMQPSPKDYADFAFGLLPGNADNQAFATPDNVRGLLDSSNLLSILSVDIRDAAASNYFLNIHYALYSQTVPEQRG